MANDLAEVLNEAKGLDGLEFAIIKWIAADDVYEVDLWDRACYSLESSDTSLYEAMKSAIDKWPPARGGGSQ